MAQDWMFQPDVLRSDPGDTGRGEAEGSSVAEVQPGSISLGVSLALGESCLLSAVAAASSRSVLVNNSVSHPYELRV